MQLRPLGRSGLQVSPLAFGGNVFGWTVDESLSFSLLDAWLDAGFNFVDTADVYSRWVPGHAGGESETMIGRLRKVGSASGWCSPPRSARRWATARKDFHPGNW